jgi:quinol monooxygenase YgiN
MSMQVGSTTKELTVSDEAQVTVIARFTPAAGRSGDLQALLRETITPSRSEPGCRPYELFSTEGNPADRVLVEHYEDSRALEEHRTSRDASRFPLGGDYGHVFIDGSWRIGSRGGPVQVINPSTNDTLVEFSVTQANDTVYGLASYWSADERRCHRLARDLESSNVFINTYRYASEVPFGGYKHSGIGREHGLEALREYTQLKSVVVALDKWNDCVMSPTGTPQA